MLGIQGAQPAPAGQGNRLEDKLSSERTRLERLSYTTDKIDEKIDRLRRVLTTGVKPGDPSLHATGEWEFEIETISPEPPHTRAYNYKKTRYPDVHCSWRGPSGDTHCKGARGTDAIGYFEGEFLKKASRGKTKEAWEDWKQQSAPWVKGSEEGGGPVTGRHEFYSVHREAADRRPPRFNPMS